MCKYRKIIISKKYYKSKIPKMPINWIEKPQPQWLWLIW